MRYTGSYVELNYEIRERAPQRLVFESDGDRRTLTFPLSPSWLVYVSVGSIFAIVAAKVVLVAFFLWTLWHFPMRLPIPWGMLGAYLVSASTLGVIGWSTLRSHRRYGHVPRAVWIDPIRKIIGHRGERAARAREWPLADVRQVRVTTIRHLTGRRAAEVVRIRLRRRILPLVITFRLKDQAVLRSLIDFLTPLIPAATIRLPTPSVAAARPADGDLVPRSGADGV